MSNSREQELMERIKILEQELSRLKERGSSRIAVSDLVELLQKKDKPISNELSKKIETAIDAIIEYAKKTNAI